MFENFNHRNGILNRINAYTKFITNIQNKFTPNKKPIENQEHPWENDEEYQKSKAKSKKLFKLYKYNSSSENKINYINAK